MSTTTRILIVIATLTAALSAYAQDDAAPEYIYQRGQPMERQAQAWSNIDGLSRLDLGGGEVDAGVLREHVKPIETLRALRLSGAIGKDGYQALGQIKQLRTLEIVALGSSNSGAFFDGIVDLPLSELIIERCTVVDFSQVRHLRCTQTLERLEIPQYRGTIDDDSLKHLAAFTELRHLNLNQQTNIKKGVGHLAALTKLESLSMYGVPFIDDESLTMLFQNTPKLSHLNLGFCWWHKGEGLIFPASLTHLNLVESKQLTDAAFAELPCRDNLIEADLYLCLALTDRSIQAFEGAKRIERLNVGCIRALTNESLKIIGGLCTLTHLNIGDNDRFDDDGLACLADLTNMQSLNLWHLRGVTGSGLKHLNKMAALTELNLSDCRNLEDIGVITIARLPALEYLYLDNCIKLTDPAIASLAGHKRLKYLSLSGCELLTDEAAKHLAMLPSLRHLDIRACAEMTDEAIARLEETLPECRVVH